MARTKTYMNWKDISVSYGVGPTSVALTEITDLNVDVSDDLERWMADGNRFATTVVVASSERGGSIMGGDIAKLIALPTGTYCTVTAKLYDSVNGVGSGCLTFVWTRAVFEKKSAKGASNKFAGGQVSWSCSSADGTTDPLTITEAT